MRTKRKTLVRILIIISIFTAMYLLYAFATIELNPFNWNSDSRFAYPVFSTVISLLLIIYMNISSVDK